METIYYVISTDNKIEFYEQVESSIRPINSAKKHSLDVAMWNWFENTIGNLDENNIIFIANTKIDVPTQIANNTNECDVNLLKTALNFIYNSKEVEVDETVISVNNSEFPMYLIHPTKLIQEINESSKIESKVEDETKVTVNKTEKSSMKKTFERLNKNANYSKPL